MKPCDHRWREDLLDHVLGLPASAALTEHLANCAVCPEVLRQWKAQMAQVDAGIAGLTASEPAADAAPRIMAELHTRGQRVWLPGWQWRTATLCGLVMVIASTFYLSKAHEQRIEAERAFSAALAIGSWRSPTESLLRSPTDRWLKAPPQLGKYFYQLNTNSPGKERDHP
jgi:anti-sigma factor RsiW